MALAEGTLFDSGKDVQVRVGDNHMGCSFWQRPEAAPNGRSGDARRSVSVWTCEVFEVSNHIY